MLTVISSQAVAKPVITGNRGVEVEGLQNTYSFYSERLYWAFIST